MNLQVLIPTYKKTREDIIHLCASLNIQSDAIIANQIGINEQYSLTYNNHVIKVICSNTIGVSINRNILLKNASGDLNLMIDDDCRLADNYENIVRKLYNYFSFDFAIFNGVYLKERNRLVHNKKTKKIKYFYQVSYGGGPGFCFKKDKLDCLSLKYNEKVGTPNYICAGEDSLFYYQLVKNKVNFVRSSDVVFEILNSRNESSYFSGINEQYITTRGYIIAKIHKRLFFFYKIKHCLRFKRDNPTLSIGDIFKWFNNGRKMLRSSNESSIY